MPFLTQGKTNWKFLLIVIVLAAIVGGGILWCQKIQEITYQSPEIQKLEEVDEPVAWQTYRNEEYGFEIKYPENWFVHDATNEINCENKLAGQPTRILFSDKGIEDCLESLTHGWFWFSIWIDEEYNEGNIGENTLFNGIPANKTIEAEVNEIGDSPRTSIIFNHNNSGWNINYLNNIGGAPADSSFEKMLSTLRFIGEETAGWQTYRNEQYGFEIKYPSNFCIEDNMEATNYMKIQDCELKKQLLHNPGVLIKIINSDLSLRDYLNKTGNSESLLDESAPPGYTHYSVKDIEDITLNNITALQFFSAAVSDSSVNTLIKIPQENIIINIIKINTGLGNFPDDIYSQILSTFRFIGPITELIPVIDSISPDSVPIGTPIEIRGKNFSGFEGDLNAWIENTEGVKGIIYGEADSSDNLIKFTLNSSYCQIDTSYSGLPCPDFIYLNPGTYKIYVIPWGQKSNEVIFTVTSP